MMLPTLLRSAVQRTIEPETTGEGDVDSYELLATRGRKRLTKGGFSIYSMSLVASQTGWKTAAQFYFLPNPKQRTELRKLRPFFGRLTRSRPECLTTFSVLDTGHMLGHLKLRLAPCKAGELVVRGPIQKFGPFISFRGEEGLIS